MLADELPEDELPDDEPLDDEPRSIDGSVASISSPDTAVVPEVRVQAALVRPRRRREHDRLRHLVGAEHRAEPASRRARPPASPRRAAGASPSVVPSGTSETSSARPSASGTASGSEARPRRPRSLGSAPGAETLADADDEHPSMTRPSSDPSTAEKYPATSASTARHRPPSVGAVKTFHSDPSALPDATSSYAPGSIAGKGWCRHLVERRRLDRHRLRRSRTPRARSAHRRLLRRTRAPRTRPARRRSRPDAVGPDVERPGIRVVRVVRR